MTKTRREKEREQELLELGEFPTGGDEGMTPDDDLPGINTSSNGKDFLARTTPARIQRSSVVEDFGASQAAQTAGPILSPLSKRGGGIDWEQVESYLAHDEGIYRAFDEVLNRGSLDDLARVMELLGPRPEKLSTSQKNRVYEGVSIMLIKGHHIERNLIWVLGLVRSRLVDLLSRHVQYDLKAGNACYPLNTPLDLKLLLILNILTHTPLSYPSLSYPSFTPLIHPSLARYNSCILAQFFSSLIDRFNTTQQHRP